MKKILIIDDENLVRRTLERVLVQGNNNIEVKSAANGTDGKKLWLEMKPDLVIMDVLMPDISGPNVINSIPASDRKKIILISAHQDETQVKNANLPIDLFISKPFDDIFALRDRILEVLA